MLAADVLSGDELTTCFSDIGGMEKELEDVIDNVILPIKVWRKIRHEGKAVPIPTGILLYGRPGMCLYVLAD